MANTRDIPDPWGPALLKAGFVHPQTGNPAVAPLAREAGVAQTTVWNIIQGKTIPTVKTVQDIADALGVSAPTVAKWMGNPGVAGSQQRELPPEAIVLTAREWKAVVEIIRAFAAAHGGGRPIPESRKVTGKRPATPRNTATKATPRRVPKVARERTD